MKVESQVVARFAPSPTGFAHLGTIRTALFNFLFTQNTQGKLILRLEDTDRERSRPEYEKDIIDNLDWLGLTFAERYRQSERGEIYKEWIEKLIARDKAYRSRETRPDGSESEVIRFRNPGQKVVFSDLIRGAIEFDTTELKDFVIAKSLDEPLFHLAVVLDDHLMGVTHVIRGEDHISNTPRQILIQEALGARRPVYAHIPLILGADRTKMSKRHGAATINEYREMGYLPAALLNYLALLGWNPGTDQEIFTLEELSKVFHLEHAQKGGAIFNPEKLKWFNREHLKLLSPDNFIKEVEKYLGRELPPKLVGLCRERASTFSEIRTLLESGEFDYLSQTPTYDKALLKNTAHLGLAFNLLENISETDFTDPAKLKAVLWPEAERVGKSELLWPLRVALTGKAKSPDPFTIASILGKTETLKRLNEAKNQN